MKVGRVFKKIISSILLVSVFTVSNFSLFSPKAEAQVFGGAGGSASGGVNVQGIGAVALGCGTSFFIQRKATKRANQLSNMAEGEVIGAVGSAAQAITGVDVTSGSATPKVPVVDEKVPKSIQKEVGKVDTETTLQSFKEECLDLIARYIVLKIIDKITLMTVEWINSGFEGNPFYPENRENFFESIAKDEVTSFTGWFSLNPEDYPFGKIISETILLTVQNRLQDNLRFSLNQVLQHNNQYANYETFNARFSVGGWAGYTAFAQPNNNIFGNYLMAQNHLARRTAGTNITIAKNFQQELAEAGGLLNQRICRVSETGENDYIDKGDERHMGDYNLMPPNGLVSDIFDMLPPAVQAEFSGVTDPAAQRELYNYFVQRSKCARWETVTPGRFIAEQTTQALGSPLRNLELADELNENLGLIFDALAAQLFEQGLRAFQNTGGNYSSNPNDPNYNAIWAQSSNPDFGANSNQPTVGQVIQGTTPGSGSGSGGLDIDLLSLQQNYILEANEAVQSLSTLIRDVRALDYCVPGPNPRWYEIGSLNMQNIISSTISPNGDGAYYSQSVQDLTGISVPESAVPNFGQFNSFMNFVLNKYRDEVFANYSPLQPPPGVRPIATSLFSQIDSYQTQLEVLQSRINNLIPIIPQVQSITAQYNALTPAQQADPNSPQMQTITSLLNQISSQGSLVSSTQLQEVASSNLNYQSQIFAVNSNITSCVTETTGSAYQALEERAGYPFQSVFENPLVNQPALSPNVTRYLSNINFGDSNNEINLSGFNNLNLSIPTVSTETFSNLLQTVY
jgi:hypothetical protein